MIPFFNILLPTFGWDRICKFCHLLPLILFQNPYDDWWNTKCNILSIICNVLATIFHAIDEWGPKALIKLVCMTGLCSKHSKVILCVTNILKLNWSELELKKQISLIQKLIIKKVWFISKFWLKRTIHICNQILSLINHSEES